MDPRERYDETGDLLALRSDLDALISYKGLAYADDVDEPMRESLRASWRQLVLDGESVATGADVQDALRTYVQIGMLKRPHAHAPGSHAHHAARHGALPREAAGLLCRDVPPRGARTEGLPTIAWLAPATGEDETLPARLALFGSFTLDLGRYAFESQGEDGSVRILPVLRVDRRFEKLLATLAEGSVALVLAAERTSGLLEAWDLRAVGELPPGDARHVMEPSLLELMLGRLRSLPEPGAARPEEASRVPETRPGALLSSVDDAQSYLACMEDTLPPNIRAWAAQNLELARDAKASKEERGHAARALSLVLSVQWGRAPFERVDPARARRILDEQLFGLDSVKQRVIETIVQINRTHTLPLYGLLLTGPAGVGKSQIAYATARILDLPWASLDMSTIRDLGALAGSDRIYANAKPGRVMEALAQAGSANMVLVLNELDKAGEGGQNGSSADALLTLFDNLGFTDNYVACSVPTDGIYPIATANDLTKISSPLLSRFEVIEIPDYTPEEKRVILKEFSFPKVLAHMGLRGEEFSLTDAALDGVIERYRDESGVRSLEKAAEHLAAHALFLLESDPALGRITFDAADVQQVLDV